VNDPSPKSIEDEDCEEREAGLWDVMTISTKDSHEEGAASDWGVMKVNTRDCFEYRAVNAWNVMTINTICSRGRIAASKWMW
jgi:hypothetical protein